MLVIEPKAFWVYKILNFHRKFRILGIFFSSTFVLHTLFHLFELTVCITFCVMPNYFFNYKNVAPNLVGAGAAKIWASRAETLVLCNCTSKKNFYTKENRIKISISMTLIRNLI